MTLVMYKDCKNIVYKVIGSAFVFHSTKDGLDFWEEFSVLYDKQKNNDAYLKSTITHTYIQNLWKQKRSNR